MTRIQCSTPAGRPGCCTAGSARARWRGRGSAPPPLPSGRWPSWGSAAPWSADLLHTSGCRAPSLRLPSCADRKTFNVIRRPTTWLSPNQESRPQVYTLICRAYFSPEKHNYTIRNSNWNEVKVLIIEHLNTSNRPAWSYKVWFIEKQTSPVSVIDLCRCRSWQHRSEKEKHTGLRIYFNGLPISSIFISTILKKLNTKTILYTTPRNGFPRFPQPPPTYWAPTDVQRLASLRPPASLLSPAFSTLIPSFASCSSKIASASASELKAEITTNERSDNRVLRKKRKETHPSSATLPQRPPTCCREETLHSLSNAADERMKRLQFRGWNVVGFLAREMFVFVFFSDL